MKTAVTAAQMLVRLTGLILIVLGLAFWTGHALGLIPVHKQIGYVFVLALWAEAAFAARAAGAPGFVALVFLWGLVVAFLGMTQDRLLIGSAHWIIKLLHLLVALAALGLAERLAARAKESRTPAFSGR